MANDPNVEPKARTPRAIVKLNGIIAPAMIQFVTDQNNYYRANSFEAYFSLFYPGWESGEINWKWWSEQETIEVEIRAGYPDDPVNFTESDLEEIFYGEVDEMDVNPIENRVLLRGRDLSLRLIESKTTEKYPNLTSSDIVKKLAEDKGIEVEVVPTEGKAGRFYNEEHITLSSERTLWDLICYLAQQEDYVVFLKGRKLHFQPSPKADDSDPYIVQFRHKDETRPTISGNFMQLQMKRSLTVAKDVIVTVSSWNSKQKKAFNTTAKSAKSARKQNKGGDAQTFSYTIPGLTKEQAIKRAEKILEDITRHEINLNFEMPADNLLDEASIIRLEGTGTSFDQIYFADHVVRSYSTQQGYTMAVHAKNHSPVSTVTA